MQFMSWGLFLVGALLATFPAAAHECDVTRTQLSETQKSDFSKAIAKQLNVPPTPVINAWSYSGWYIVELTGYQSDDGYWFFSGNPVNNKYLTNWSGATAGASEEAEVKTYIVDHAAGIPDLLVSCFAKNVTMQLPGGRS